MKEVNAYEADKAVNMPILMNSCNKAAHYWFATATTLRCIHPKVVITTHKQSAYNIQLHHIVNYQDRKMSASANYN